LLFEAGRLARGESGQGYSNTTPPASPTSSRTHTEVLPRRDSASEADIAVAPITEEECGIIDQGVSRGATVVTGGKALDRPGYFDKPTIVADTQPDTRLIREQIFGPVGSVIPFDDEDEVMAAAYLNTKSTSASRATLSVKGRWSEIPEGCRRDRRCRRRWPAYHRQPGVVRTRR
jgi:Aldehyde dehydrogenase family